MEKPAGWYYVGDGKLRYRDDNGWTDYFMPTTDPLAAKWPPPPPARPKSYVEWVEEDMAARQAQAVQASRHSFRSLFRRGTSGPENE